MALFGIKKLKYCKSANLQHNVTATQSGGTTTLEVFNPATGICTVTNPLTDLTDIVKSLSPLSVDEAVVNRRKIYTAKLLFVSACHPGLSDGSFAFVVETVSGEQILLGSRTAPRCTVTTKQNIAAAPGELNAYTTTVEFKAPYKPLRIPVEAEEHHDNRQFDVCCGEVVKPSEPDARQFEVCCGEVVGEAAPIQKTVVWVDYDRTPLDHATYYSNQPEPTTSVVPTRQPTSEYTYTFAGWSLISQTATMKVYQATYTEEPIAVTITVIWQDSDGTELERKTYTEGQTEPQPSQTPANKRYNELFGYKFNGWSLYSETDDTKIYRAAYVNAIYDWSTVEPTGEQSSDLDNTGGDLGTTFEPVNSPASDKCWVFWSSDGTTLHKSPFYRSAWQSVIFNWGNIPCLVFIFIYNNTVDITESGLPPGTIESGVRGQWYALGTQGNYKVYGWRTADWTGFAPANGQFMPIG